MCKEIKNVYITNNGDISLNKGIKLASSVEDLRNWACGTGEEFGGLLQLEDGKYFSTSVEMLEEQLESIGECLDGSEVADYTVVDETVPKIYSHFMEQIDQTLYEIVTMKMSSDNSVLYAVTLPRSNNNFYHVHNVWLNEEDEIMENCSMLPRIFVDMYKIA